MNYGDLHYLLLLAFNRSNKAIVRSATRFLRNWDNIFEKNRPFLRSISEARSLASLTPF